MNYDATGAPVIPPTTPATAACPTLDGDIVIPNMAPGRYGITVRQPAEQEDWCQTTTLEGATDHDWWVMANDTGYGQETIYGSELVPEVQFGFIPPTCRRLLDAASAAGGASITGFEHEGCHYIGSPGGQAQNGVPGVNGPETMDCGAITNGVVTVEQPRPRRPARRHHQGQPDTGAFSARRAA